MSIEKDERKAGGRYTRTFRNARRRPGVLEKRPRGKRKSGRKADPSHRSRQFSEKGRERVGDDTFRYTATRGASLGRLALFSLFGVCLGDLLHVHGYEDLLARCRTLGHFDLLGGFRHGVAEAAADGGETEFSDGRGIAAIFDDEHALRAGLFVSDQSGDEVTAVGTLDGDERWGAEGLHLERVVAGGQCGILPANFMGKSKTALANVLSGSGDCACANGGQRETCDYQHAIAKRFHGSLLAKLFEFDCGLEILFWSHASEECTRLATARENGATV